MKTAPTKPLKFDGQVTELFDLTESDFNVEEGTGKMTATVRLIKAGVSKNGRNYRASALESAVKKGIFNGVRMFINHDEKLPVKRSLTDMVSAIESTTYHKQDQAIDGKVEFFDKKFFDYAQLAKNYMGDSINALVRGTKIRRPDGTAEEDIHEIVQPRSVDWVIYPAAGGEILAFEDEEGEEEVDWTAITVDDITKNAPQVLEALKADLKPETKKEESETPPVALTSEAVADLIADALKKDREAREEETTKKEDAAEKIRAAFKVSGLPDKTRTRVMASFEGVTEYDEKKVTAAITEAKEELKALGVGPTIKGMGTSQAAEGEGTESQTPAFSVKDSVEAHFGFKKPADTKKES